MTFGVPGRRVPRKHSSFRFGARHLGAMRAMLERTAESLHAGA
jgi:hypothetical protein